MLEDSSRHASSVGPWGRRQWRSHQIRHSASGIRWRVWLRDFPLTSLRTSQVLTACEKHSKLTSALVNCLADTDALLHVSKKAAAYARAHLFQNSHFHETIMPCPPSLALPPFRSSTKRS